MSNYAKLRSNAKRANTKKMNGYRDGGAVAGPKKSGTTVNIVVSPARGDAPQGAPIAPAGMIPPPSRSPAPPVPSMPSAVPPVAAQAAMNSIGASPPPMKSGGRIKRAGGGSVPMKGGAEGGLGRLEKARAAAKKRGK